MRVGLAISSVLALYVAGMTTWIMRRYFRRLREIRAEGRDRRSGLLPLHVVAVASWSTVALARMIARDYVRHHPPWWLGWPSTAVLAIWLAGALMFIAIYYRQGEQQLRHPPGEDVRGI